MNWISKIIVAYSLLIHIDIGVTYVIGYVTYVIDIGVTHVIGYVMYVIGYVNYVSVSCVRFKVIWKELNNKTFLSKTFLSKTVLSKTVLRIRNLNQCTRSIFKNDVQPWGEGRGLLKSGYLRTGGRSGNARKHLNLY